MRNQGIFLVFILSLTLGLQFAYSRFREHYSDRVELQHKLSTMTELKERQALQTALLQSQLEDLRADVYRNFKGRQGELAWQEKQWWAGLRGPASVPFMNRGAGPLLETAKKSFQDKKYAETAETLKQLIRDFPTSKDIVEAHFLRAESLYLAGQIEPSLDLIDQMMTRYPESELTGFIMLRMGQVLKERNRDQEAREVFETVLRQFSDSQALKSQTLSLLKGLPKT